MKNNKKRIIKSLESNYLARCVWEIRNRDFREKVLKIKSPDSVFVKHLGDCNPDKLICIIRVNGPYSGWFSIMNNVIMQLCYADRYNMCPVVYLASSRLYSDEDVPGDLFDYFYRQPTEISLSEANMSRNVVFSSAYNSPYSWLEIKDFSQDSDQNKYVSEVIGRYLRLNNDTDKYISESIKRALGNKKCIGVHVRGTDFKAGYKNHPIYISTEEYIDEARNLIKSGKYDLIFLATDEEETIFRFKKEFGERVVYHEAFRSSNGAAVGIHTSTGEKVRARHKYLLGLEVLTDMYTLAACDALVGCKSNVVLHAILNKLALKEKYDDLIIIDHGLYNSRLDSVTGMKKKIEATQNNR